MLFALVLTSWVSGVVFFVLDRWFLIEGEFGLEKHPWRLGFLKAHGASAFLMMVAFGFLLASHVSVAWPVRRMRPLGVALVSSLSLLMLSAYGLYYLGDENLRPIVTYAHAATGACLPFLLAAHLIQGQKRRWRRRRLQRR